MMNCQPPQPESMASLRRLREEVAARGDACLALLLGGIDVYTSVGREWELLEIMRKFAHDSQEMVRNTPSAADLEKLYRQEENGTADPS